MALDLRKSLAENMDLSAWHVLYSSPVGYQSPQLADNPLDGRAGDKYFTAAQTYVGPPICKSFADGRLRLGSSSKTFAIVGGD